MARLRKNEALFRMELDARDARNTMARAPGRIDRTISAEFRGRLSQAGVESMKDAAPEDTGDLKSELEARISYPRGGVAVSIVSPVRDPETGFSYTGVTRFGHRKDVIKPKHEGRKEVVHDGYDDFGKAIFKLPHAPALAVHVFGRNEYPIYRFQVRGYKPKFDWVEVGERDVAEDVAESADRIGRAIATRILSD